MKPIELKAAVTEMSSSSHDTIYDQRIKEVLKKSNISIAEQSQLSKEILKNLVSPDQYKKKLISLYDRGTISTETAVALHEIMLRRNPSECGRQIKIGDLDQFIKRYDQNKGWSKLIPFGSSPAIRQLKTLKTLAEKSTRKFVYESERDLVLTLSKTAVDRAISEWMETVKTSPTIEQKKFEPVSPPIADTSSSISTTELKKLVVDEKKHDKLVTSSSADTSRSKPITQPEKSAVEIWIDKVLESSNISTTKKSQLSKEIFNNLHNPEQYTQKLTEHHKNGVISTETALRLYNKMSSHNPDDRSGEKINIKVLQEIIDQYDQNKGWGRKFIPFWSSETPAIKQLKVLKKLADDHKRIYVYRSQIDLALALGKEPETATKKALTQLMETKAEVKAELKSPNPSSDSRNYNQWIEKVFKSSNISTIDQPELSKEMFDKLADPDQYKTRLIDLYNRGRISTETTLRLHHIMVVYNPNARREKIDIAILNNAIQQYDQNKGWGRQLIPFGSSPAINQLRALQTLAKQSKQKYVYESEIKLVSMLSETATERALTQLAEEVKRSDPNKTQPKEEKEKKSAKSDKTPDKQSIIQSISESPKTTTSISSVPTTSPIRLMGGIKPASPPSYKARSLSIP